MKRVLYYLLTAILLHVALPMQARQYTVESVPNVQVADRTQYVTDPDGYIDSASRLHINTMLAQLRDSNSVEAAVVILPSIGNEDIDNFATELFTHWGIGKASNDNGLLFIAVMDQRQIVIRTGYGIEGVLPDVLCSRIIRRYITPSFREGAYGKGMSDAVEQTLHIIMTPEASAELIADEPLFDEADKAALYTLLYVYVLLSLFISFLLSVRIKRTVSKYRNAPYQCYKELNSNNLAILLLAIFFPVWGVINYVYCRQVMKKMRTMPRNCGNCGTAMQRLSEVEDNRYLSPQEDTEERIGSVDYDVWMCHNCQNTEVFRFDKKYTQYSECPHCHAKAYSIAHDHIILPATTLSPGKGEKVYTCQHCHKRNVIPYIIPMIVVPKNSGGSGGGFGGGFGGGMTGGGGARGGW
ncbi:MAG: TPM domain-containing protein [Bacteroidaceae bacterium]|nr:TPM domain-containing protein [Bacteroidaceae bacterium]